MVCITFCGRGVCSASRGLKARLLAVQAQKVSPKHDGKITEVTGCRVHSKEAGGLEVPCRLKFIGCFRNVRKLVTVCMLML